jgi:5-methylthioadenosine/S-adenosylhomocysteine deaminase
MAATEDLLIRNARIVTMNDQWDVIDGDVLVQDGRITAIGTSAPPPPGTPAPRHLDAAGTFLLPGFIQTHIHLCQTLFRGLADDLPLLAWLRQRVWPLEAAHDATTLRVAARTAAAELLTGGTTCVLTMETVHDTDAVCDALVETGLRAVVGKCLMDTRGDAPARLWQAAQDGIDETLALHRRWHGAANGRLRIALAPRFAISCTRDLLEAVAATARQHGLLVHTHASEQRDEVDLVRSMTGLDNMAYLASVGLATPHLCAAHCVWVTPEEQALMAERDVKVLHCPSSNLKLGSGVAPVADFRRRQITVSLGADGAACANALDMFQEMRLAATLQAMRVGPGALPARDVVAMATRDGARTLGLFDEIGSIELGKRADLILVAHDQLHQQPAVDPYTTLVYATRASDVRCTIVDGRIVAQRGQVTWADQTMLGADAGAAARRLIDRAGL